MSFNFGGGGGGFGLNKPTGNTSAFGTGFGTPAAQTNTFSAVQQTPRFGAGVGSSSGGTATGFGTGAAAQSNKNTDVEVPNPPEDSVIQVAFSPTSPNPTVDFLAVSSWDQSVRIYEVTTAYNGVQAPQVQNIAAKSLFNQHAAIPLAMTWHNDGSKLFVGGDKKIAHCYDLTTGQNVQVGTHDGPIKCMRWVLPPSAPQGLLVTGSWDKTLRYWDCQSPQPALTVNLPERCYAMDAHSTNPQDPRNYLVVGTADRHILIYDLRKPNEPYKQMQSPLRWQTRAIAACPDTTQPSPNRTTDTNPNTSAQGYKPGFAVSSIEGRVAVQYLEQKDEPANFSFRCHRVDPPANSRDEKGLPRVPSAYAVHDMAFNPVYGTFATSGADGKIIMWDKDSKTRLKALDDRGGPIVSSSFNKSGRVLAYGVSYDWGHGYQDSNRPIKVCLHPFPEDEILRKNPNKK